MHLKVKIINFKLFDTYGVNDNRKKILYLLLNSLKKIKKLKTTKGLQRINLTEINDICRGINLGINESKMEISERWNFKILFRSKKSINIKSKNL